MVVVPVLLALFKIGWSHFSVGFCLSDFHVTWLKSELLTLKFLRSTDRK